MLPGAKLAGAVLPELALVPGEPAGIGPELCIRLIQQPRTDCRLLAFADPATLHAAADALSLPLQLLPADAEARLPGDLRLHPLANAVPSRFGHADPRNAAAVIGALQAAGQACLDGRLDGVVTGPVHKAVINQGGIAYSGTTELLAEHARCPVVMMLANDIVRVALATTHLPLAAGQKPPRLPSHDPIDRADLSLDTIIPDSAKEKPQEAEVIAVGPGRVDDKGVRIPVDVNVGDKVIFSKYGGTELKYDGKEYLVLSARDVLAIIER